MFHPPELEDAWTVRTIQAMLGSNAVTLHRGLVCMGNGTCSYEALPLTITGFGNEDNSRITFIEKAPTQARITWF